MTITTTSERTAHWAKMRPPFALFSGSEPSRHMRSSVDFITITFGSRFSVHTMATLWVVSRQPHTDPVSFSEQKLKEFTGLPADEGSHASPRMMRWFYLMARICTD